MKSIHKALLSLFFVVVALLFMVPNSFGLTVEQGVVFVPSGANTTYHVNQTMTLARSVDLNSTAVLFDGFTLQAINHGSGNIEVYYSTTARYASVYSRTAGRNVSVQNLTNAIAGTYEIVLNGNSQGAFTSFTIVQTNANQLYVYQISQSTQTQTDLDTGYAQIFGAIPMTVGGLALLAIMFVLAMMFGFLKGDAPDAMEATGGISGVFVALFVVVVLIIMGAIAYATLMG